jgi:hypothetical protein
MSERTARVISIVNGLIVVATIVAMVWLMVAPP